MRLTVKVRNETAAVLAWSGGVKGGTFSLKATRDAFKGLVEEFEMWIAEEDDAVATPDGFSSDPGNQYVVIEKIASVCRHHNIVADEEFMSMEVTAPPPVPPLPEDPEGRILY